MFAYALCVLIATLLVAIALGMLFVLLLEWWDNTPETTRINQVGVLSGFVMTGLTITLFNY